MTARCRPDPLGPSVALFRPSSQGRGCRSHPFPCSGLHIKHGIATRQTTVKISSYVCYSQLREGYKPTFYEMRMRNIWINREKQKALMRCLQTRSKLKNTTMFKVIGKLVQMYWPCTCHTSWITASAYAATPVILAASFLWNGKICT